VNYEKTKRSLFYETPCSTYSNKQTDRRWVQSVVRRVLLVVSAVTSPASNCVSSTPHIPTRLLWNLNWCIWSSLLWLLSILELRQLETAFQHGERYPDAVTRQRIAAWTELSEVRVRVSLSLRTTVMSGGLNVSPVFTILSWIHRLIGEPKYLTCPLLEHTIGRPDFAFCSQI